MNVIEEYVSYLTEVNRIVQGLSRRTGKPKEHIQKIWKDTEREVLLKHRYGVSDRYKQIGNIVRSKLGQKPDVDDKTDGRDEEQENK